MQWLRTLVANRSGAAAAEMALVLPMLLALMFICLEGGHYLYVEHLVVKGVRDGARFAARQNFADFPNCSTISDAAATRIKEVTRTGAVAGGATRVRNWDNTEVTVTASCPATPLTSGIYEDRANAQQVTVSASVPYPSLFSALGGMPTDAVIYARDQAAVMGL